MNSVWEAAPGMNGLFFETQRAAYNARVDDGA